MSRWELLGWSCLIECFSGQITSRFRKKFQMKIRIVSKGLFSSIKQFTFLKQVGLGSFGSVKMALHIDSGKLYGIKIIELTQQLSQNQLLILEREISIHSHIDHPHIIKLWDTLQQNQHIYMVMELAQNGSLFSYQNYHPTLSESESFKFFQQSVSAIRYLHNKDIMHRDIKPENILLDKNNNIKICDLGWATDNIKSKRTTFCGTYEYMAPQMAFEQQYNYKIDIWALGILLYQLLHGYAPFKARSLEEIQHKIKKGFYEVGKNLSKDLKNLIIETLQFDYNLRPEFEEISQHPWVQAMKNEVKNQAIKLKQSFEGDSKRKKFQVDKENKDGLQDNSHYKKQRKYDSSLNDVNFRKDQQVPIETLLSTGTGLSQAEREKQVKTSKLKKKCKTQGEESIEKYLKCEIAPYKNYHNMNTKNHHISYLSKMDDYYLRNNNDSKLHQKKLTEKIHEISCKTNLEKKKTRIKTPSNFSKFN